MAEAAAQGVEDPWPSLFLGLGAGVEEPLPLFAAAKGEVNL
jgi:hypothetical protein